jgi:hypothetical protein
VQAAAARFVVLFCAIAALSAAGAVNNSNIDLVLDDALAIMSGPPNNGQGSIGTLIPQSLAGVTNCSNNPGTFLKPCPAAGADVSLVETPEPGPGWLLLCGLALMGLGWRRPRI